MDSQGFVEVPDCTRATVFRSARPVPEHVVTLDLPTIYAEYAAAAGVSDLTDEQQGQAILVAIVEAVGHE
jgi:hypothetical protein